MNRTNWKLIKTAPKDGTEIIGVHISEWGDRQKTLYGPWTVAFRSGRWQSSWDGVQVIDYMSDFGTDYKTPDLEPTHWIPLPEVVNTDPEGSSRTETSPRFNHVMKHLGVWRNADHEDNLTLCRSDVIEIIEGVKLLEAVAETDADAQRDAGLLSGVSADPTPPNTEH